MRKLMSAALLTAMAVSMGFTPSTADAITRQQAINIINYKNAKTELENQVVNKYNSGLNAYKSKNYSGCVSALMTNAVNLKYSNTKDYNLALGDSYYHLKNYGQGISFLRKAINMGADTLVANVSLGMAYYNIKNYGQAAIFLNKAASSSLATGEVLWALADSHAQNGNTKAQIEALKMVISRYPTYKKDAYVTVGMYYLEQNNLSQAMSVFKQGLTYFQNDGDLLYWVGHVYYIQGDYSTAAEYLEKSNIIMPYNIDTLYDLGFSYLKLDQLDNASSCVELMSKRDANNQKTQELSKAVQQKIMEKQMQQMMQDQMNQEAMQMAQEAANTGMEQANMQMPAGM